jgi:hypothetical protein
VAQVAQDTCTNCAWSRHWVTQRWPNEAASTYTRCAAQQHGSEDGTKAGQTHRSQNTWSSPLLGCNCESQHTQMALRGATTTTGAEQQNHYLDITVCKPSSDTPRLDVLDEGAEGAEPQLTRLALPPALPTHKLFAVGAPATVARGLLGPATWAHAARNQKTGPRLSTRGCSGAQGRVAVKTIARRHNPVHTALKLRDHAPPTKTAPLLASPGPQQ